MRGLRAAQFREDAGPLAHPVQPDHYITIDNFYTATIYNKGAEVIRMMATIIGRENFRRGMDLYFARHDNQAVTIDDFAQAMQDASGDRSDAVQALVSSGRHAGGRAIRQLRCGDQSLHADVAPAHTRPTPGQPDKQPLVIPVVMGLLDGDGSELAARTLLLH